MPCGSTVAPSAHQTMQSCCVNRRSTGALVRLIYVGAQWKTNSDVNGAIVKSQAYSRALSVASLRLLIIVCLSDAVSVPR